MSLKQTLVEAAKDAPIPAVPLTFHVLGLPLDSWVVVLTALWAAWRVFDGALTTYWKWKDRREAERNGK